LSILHHFRALLGGRLRILNYYSRSILKKAEQKGPIGNIQVCGQFTPYQWLVAESRYGESGENGSTPTG
jgi:hypothetical protein